MDYKDLNGDEKTSNNLQVSFNFVSKSIHNNFPNVTASCFNFQYYELYNIKARFS